jgi:hypothetical protein
MKIINEITELKFNFRYQVRQKVMDIIEPELLFSGKINVRDDIPKNLCSNIRRKIKNEFS